MYLDCGPDGVLDRADQRDPFARPARAAVEEPSAPEAVPFALRGLVLAPAPAALVLEADGRSRLVRVGDRLGVWIVQHVDHHGLIVREDVSQDRSGRFAREVHLRLSPRATPSATTQGGR